VQAECRLPLSSFELTGKSSRCPRYARSRRSNWSIPPRWRSAFVTRTDQWQPAYSPHRRQILAGSRPNTRLLSFGRFGVSILTTGLPLVRQDFSPWLGMNAAFFLACLSCRDRGLPGGGGSSSSPRSPLASRCSCPRRTWERRPYSRRHGRYSDRSRRTDSRTGRWSGCSGWSTASRLIPTRGGVRSGHELCPDAKRDPGSS
jgi:hypothetical protein